MFSKPVVVSKNSENSEAILLAEKLNTDILTEIPKDCLSVVFDESGVSLTKAGLTMQADFSHMTERIRQGRLQQEMLVKAAKFKGLEGPFYGIDATAGLGEDGMILAATGINMTLYEYNPVIAELLRDALRRAAENSALSEAVSRMKVVEGDSIKAMEEYSQPLDLILLDPMFPKREKTGLIKKKFQLLQQLEQPCSNEEDMLNAAISCKPRKILIKRPQKGPWLGNRKPDYIIEGKAIRYDCIAFPR